MELIYLIAIGITIIFLIINIYKNIKVLIEKPTFSKYAIKRDIDFKNKVQEIYLDFVEYIDAINEKKRLESFSLLYPRKVKASRRLLLFIRAKKYKSKLIKTDKEIKEIENKLSTIKCSVEIIEKMNTLDPHIKEDFNIVKTIIGPYNTDFKAFFSRVPLATVLKEETYYFFLLPFIFIYDSKTGDYTFEYYSDVKIEIFATREEAYSTKKDDDVVSRRWLNQRKDGGPDRRYKTNYLIYTINKWHFSLILKNRMLLFDCKNKKTAFLWEKEMKNFLCYYNKIFKELKVYIDDIFENAICLFPN